MFFQEISKQINQQHTTMHAVIKKSYKQMKNYFPPSRHGEPAFNFRQTKEKSNY